MSKKGFMILDAEAFSHWKASMETEAVMAALSEFARQREQLAKEQMYENSDPEALMRLHIHKEAVRLANEFVTDFVNLEYVSYRGWFASDDTELEFDNPED